MVFLVDSRQNVTRVPLDAIRWVHERGYVALYDPSSTNKTQKWRWKEVHLGLSDLHYAEVFSGARAGRPGRGLASRAARLPSCHERTEPRRRSPLR